MAGLDVAEGQGHQARPVGLGHSFDALAAQALQQQANVGQLVGRDEAVLLEQRVVGRQAGEQLDHGLGDGEAHALQLEVEAGRLQHRLHVGVGRDVVAVEVLADRRAEQQVLGHRQVAVVAVGVERLDQAGIARILQAAMQRVARLQDALGEIGPQRRDRSCRAGRANRCPRRARPASAPRPCAAAGRPGRWRRPARSRSSRRWDRAPDCRRARLPSRTASRSALVASSYVRRRDRPDLQAEQQVVAHRQREEIGLLPDIGGARAQHVLGQLEEVLAVELDRAAGRQREPRQHLAQHVLARARAADHRELAGRSAGSATRCRAASPGRPRTP